MSENSDFPYIHGFSEEEQDRLRRQAEIFEQIIYQDVDFSESNRIIEVGSGIGAQTEILLRRFPQLQIQCVEMNDKQIETAKKRLSPQKHLSGRYKIEKADASNLPFNGGEFDGAFVCWVLEHVPQPKTILSDLRRVVREGGKVVITEVNNSSFFLDPYSPNVWKYWMAFNDFQFENAGDPFVGVKLGNQLQSQGYRDIQTEVKTLFFDNRNPDKRKRTILFWAELMLSGANQLIENGSVTEELVKEVRRELDEVSKDPNAIFYYSFVQAHARV